MVPDKNESAFLPSPTRRNVLALFTGIACGLSGCSTPNDLTGSSQTSSNTPTQTAEQMPSSWEQGSPSWNAFQTPKQDYQIFEGASQVNLTNDNYPNTHEVTFSTTENTVEVEHESLRVTSDITAELYMIQDGDSQQIGAETIPANSSTGQQNYETVTIEFDDKPEPDTHIPVYYTLVFVDPHHNLAPDGRVIKTAREIHVPYEAPNGEQNTHKISASEATHEANQTVGQQPELWNALNSEQLDNGDRLAYGIVSHGDVGQTYGLATQIDQATYEEESGGADYWLDLINENTGAESYVHLENIAMQFKEGNDRLGHWTNTREKITRMTEFISNLPYAFATETVVTPTEFLVSDEGRNCTEKTTLFNALLQCDPFNYTGEDAGYLHCLLQGSNPHLITGVSTEKFEDIPENWSRYRYTDQYDVDYPETEFIAVDVTTGEVGELADTTTSIWGMDNLDADHLPQI